MDAVRAGGLRWNVASWGARQSALAPILFLHGFTGLGRGWEEVAAPLAAARLCLAPDLPGHGGTEAPPPDFGLREAAAALRDLLEDYAVSRAAVVGYSMGGRLALHLAVFQSACVERLVLIGASPGLADRGERLERSHEDDAWARRIEDEGMESFVRGWMSQPLFRAGQALPMARREALRREKLSHEPASLAAALRAFSVSKQEPLHRALAAVTAPALLVVGEHDAKYRRLAEEMAEEIPNARVEVVAGAGHAPQIEAPEEFLSTVVPFLEG